MVLRVTEFCSEGTRNSRIDNVNAHSGMLCEQVTHALLALEQQTGHDARHAQYEEDVFSGEAFNATQRTSP